MDLVQTAWVAGYLEGEGCFTPTSVSKSDGRRSYPLIQVVSTDKDVLELLLDVVGVGGIHGPHKTRSEKHNPTYGYVVRGIVAIDVMEAVYPYLGKRRQAQIIDGLQKVVAISENGRPHGNEIRQRAASFLALLGS